MHKIRRCGIVHIRKKVGTLSVQTDSVATENIFISCYLVTLPEVNVILILLDKLHVAPNAKKPTLVIIGSMRMLFSFFR